MFITFNDHLLHPSSYRNFNDLDLSLKVRANTNKKKRDFFYRPKITHFIRTNIIISLPSDQ